MTEIWGVFNCDGEFSRFFDREDVDIRLAISFSDSEYPFAAPHTAARIYTAAEVRAILSDMPEAAARFEGAK